MTHGDFQLSATKRDDRPRAKGFRSKHLKLLYHVRELI